VSELKAGEQLIYGQEGLAVYPLPKLTMAMGHVPSRVHILHAYDLVREDLVLAKGIDQKECHKQADEILCDAESRTYLLFRMIFRRLSASCSGRYCMPKSGQATGKLERYLSNSAPASLFLLT